MTKLIDTAKEGAIFFGIPFTLMLALEPSFLAHFWACLALAYTVYAIAHLHTGDLKEQS